MTFPTFDIDSATATATTITDDRFAELEAMPKFKRLREWTEDERDGYLARTWLKGNANTAARAARKTPDAPKTSTRTTRTASNPFTRRHTIHDAGCSCGNYSGPGSLCIGREF